MIAIKNMEMPKRCAECKFCINQKTNDYGSYGQCVAQDCETVNTLNWSLPPSCPLVEIITCKDCKYWHDDGIITTCNQNIGYGFPSNHFCADAEKRK